MSAQIVVLPLDERRQREGNIRVEVTVSADQFDKLQAWFTHDAYEKAQAARNADLQGCLASIEIAMQWAMHHDCSGAAVFARLLASLYNGHRVQMDVSRIVFSLDGENFEHAMNVIRLCRETSREPHTFFKNGGELFEAMIKRWGFEKKRRAR